MQATPILSPDIRKVGRRFGFAVSIAVNLAMLFIIQNLLDWGWPSFLTEEFDRVVPWISFSILVSIAANVGYFVLDDRDLRHIGEIMVNLVSLTVTLRVLSVFPFDFSAYRFDWAVVARVVLILAVVGTAAGAVTEAVRFITDSKSIAKEGSDANGI